MKPLHRKIALISAVALTAVLVWRAPDPVSVPVPKGKAGNRTGASVADAARTGAAPDKNGTAIDAHLPTREPLGASRQDIFAARSWVPPPPPPGPPQPLPPPVPPANPFRFAGRVVQDGQTQVFLSKGDLTVPIKAGEVLDTTYRIEEITPSRIVMTYLPLAHRDVLLIDGPGGGVGAEPRALPPPIAGLSSGVSPAPTGAPTPSTLAVSATSAGRAKLAWEGPAQVKLGAPFSLALRVMSVQPVSGSPLQVRYDPKVLEHVAVRPGKIFSSGIGDGFNSRVNADGSIFIGASTSAQPSSGDLELMVLTFKPIRAGAAAEVNVSTLNLQGAGGRALPYDAPGAFRVPVVP